MMHRHQPQPRRGLLLSIADHLQATPPPLTTGAAAAKEPEELALLGGPKAIYREVSESLFKWPIITEEDEQAVLEVLRGGHGGMSGTAMTRIFEEEFATWIGRKHALAYPNGTMSILAAM